MRGCIAYSAITSLVEADMALAFEYYMNTTYEFGSSFQEQLAESGSSLWWHLENLGRVKGRIWAGNGSNALGNWDVAVMTTEEKAEFFLEGRYAEADSAESDLFRVTEDSLDSGDLPDRDPGDSELPDEDIKDWDFPEEEDYENEEDRGRKEDPADSNLGSREPLWGTMDAGTLDSGTTRAVGRRTAFPEAAPGMPGTGLTLSWRSPRSTRWS